MTEAQIEDCDQCLNRRRGTQDLDRPCTIIGKNTDFDGKCTDFDRDSGVIVGVQNKINAIRPNKKRAEIAQFFIWAVMGIELLSIGSSYLQILLLNALQIGEEVTDLMIESNDNREQLMGIAYTVFMAMSAFTFIQWFRRGYYNLSLRTSIEHGEGWAAGSWFVPLMNLFRPYQIMKELSTKTTNLINKKSIHFTQNNTTLISVWWSLWIFGNYAGRLLTRASNNLDSIEKLLYSTKIDIVLSLFMIPLSIIAVLMIRDYSKKEEQLSELETNSNAQGLASLTNSF